MIPKFDIGQSVQVVDSGGNPRLKPGDVLTVAAATLIPPIVGEWDSAEWAYDFVEPYGCLHESRLKSA